MMFLVRIGIISKTLTEYPAFIILADKKSCPKNRAETVEFIKESTNARNFFRSLSLTKMNAVVISLKDSN